MSKKATRNKQSSVEQVAQLMADQITALSSATAVSSSSSDPPPPPVDTASAPASSSTDPSASPATPSASVPAPSSSSTDAPTTTSTASSSSSSSGSASSLPSFSLPILLPNVSSDNKNQVTMWPPMYMFQPHLLGSLLKNGTNSDGSTMSVATLEQWQSQLAALPAQFANMAAQNNPALLALAESKNAADKKEKRSSNSSRKERVFACQQPGCNSTFNTRFSLKRHLKKHSGDRPYVCTHELGRDFGAKQCGRRFAEMSTLKRHVRTHTGERPYRCNFPGCGKSFADRTNVRRHRQTHVHSKPYSCPGDNCDRTFVRKGFLAKHIASRHKYMSTPLGLLSGNASGSGSEETEDDSVDGDDMDHDDEVTNDTPVVATSAPASISSLAGSSTSVPIVLPPLPASIAAVVSSSVAAATSAAASASSASTTSDS